MENLNNSVRLVTDKLLCTSCGACAGACPQRAILMRLNPYGIYQPDIDATRCNNCGLCLQICPGLGFDYLAYNKRIFDRLPENAALGNYRNCYSGRASELEVLKATQSGGFVSTLLNFALATGSCDGAVVTRWQQERPFEPEVLIAKTAAEVITAAGSKYNPVPVAAVLKDILEQDGTVIFVGLPCQIQALRKAETIIPQLKKKICLYIGLHCLKVFNYHYHAQILFKLKLKRAEVSYFRFRDKAWRGWPCDMRLIAKNGTVYDLPGPFSRLWARSYFSSWRCHLCFDKLNEFSDISCGDCRIPRQYGQESMKNAQYKDLGLSDVIVRTERGAAIFDQLLQRKLFRAEKSEAQELARSTAVAEKKLGINDFEAFTRICGLGFPEYGVRFRRVRQLSLLDRVLKPYSILASAHYYICHVWSRYRWFRQILKLTPHRLLKATEILIKRPVYYVRNYNKTDLVIQRRRPAPEPTAANLSS